MVNFSIIIVVNFWIIINTFPNKLQQLLETHYVDPAFDYAELCTLLAMSRSQVYRLCKEHGLGAPSYYIRAYRLEKATQLLVDTNLSVKEIAYQVGYQSVTLFFDNFKAAYLVSPLVFRERAN